MTNQEIVKVLELLETAYGAKKFYADTNKEKVIWLWSVMFRDDEAIEVNRAVINCISTLQFAPTIADIKQRIAKAKMAGQLTEMEAFHLIAKASEDATDWKTAEAKFTGLPKILQKIVGSPGQLRNWRKVSEEQFETVIASNIMRSYRELASQERDFYALPEQLQMSEQWRIEGPEYEPPQLPEPPKYELPEELNRERKVIMTEKRQAMMEDFKKGNDAEISGDMPLL